jgi:hypothetical protein
MATKKTPSDDQHARNVEKVEAFKRLAVKRVNKALATFKGIAQLSNKSAYAYDVSQVQAILNALQAGVISIKASFEKPDAPSGGGFTL